mmetsp:Transcript_15010/g.14880  ORF Transcript_15010/g.14880 Transcript_15010/m.14880 type:complete len:331 (+) Transcript_15010:381-1373(+)
MFLYVHQMFTITLETMKDSIKNKQKSSFKKFMIYASKFSSLSEVIFAAFYAKPDDLLFKSIDDPDWVRFFEVYDCYEPKDLKKFNKQYTSLCHFLALGSAFISKAGHRKNSITSLISQGRYAAYYFIFKKKRLEQFDMFMSNPDIDLCLKVYNMPETDFVKKLNEITLPKIKMHKVVYLPMTDEVLTLENLLETSEDYQNYLKQIDLGLEPKISFRKKRKTSKEETKSIPKAGSMYENSGISNRMSGTHYMDMQGPINDVYMTKSRLYDSETNVMVRILSPFTFPVDWKNKTLKLNVIDKANGNPQRKAKASKDIPEQEKKSSPSFWKLL